MNYDIGIRCGYLLSMSDENGLILKDQFLGIQGAKIASIEPWEEGKQKTAKEFIDARQKIVMPGLVNGHTHLPMSLFRGLADDLPFNEWLHNYILPLEGRLVDRDFIRVGTELSALEMIRMGTTTACDMYFFEEEVAAVLDRAGLRGLLSQTIMDFPTPDKKENAQEPWRILDRLVEKYGRHERLIPCLGPHAPYSCSDDTLKEVLRYQSRTSLPLVMHVSETEFEVKESFKQYSCSPVERLHALGALSDKAIFAHCVHLSEKDIELIVETKTAIVHNPESNMKLGAGAAPIAKYIKKGIRLGLGTDGAASNNNLNMFHEMDTAAKLQKMISGDNTAMSAKQALLMATKWGAEALGIGHLVGTLEVGKLADIITIDLQYPHMQPVHDVVSQLVYSSSGMEVETVICHGKVLLEDGKFCTLDDQKIYSEANDWQSKIQKSLTAWK